MIPTEFISICETLYGPRWIATLARKLVREDRTIRRWKSGESPVPKKVAEWLRKRALAAEAGRKRP
jgi:hypothetical protein